MATPSHTVDLLVPGLLGPMDMVDQLPSLSQLERLLSRANRGAVTGDDLETTLFSRFGVRAEAPADLPVAAYSRLADGYPGDEGFHLQANPVFFRPDRDRLLLFDSVDLDFSDEEAEGLIALFNEHFAAEGWRLETGSAHRWYLSLDRAPGISTSAISHVFGRSIDRFLPAGEASMRWHGVINEIQMLFYTSSLNFDRESRGKLPINGLWFSGGGRLLEKLGKAYTSLYADDPLARGLGLSSGADVQPLGESAADAVPGEGASLVVYDKLQRPVWRADPYDWADALQAFALWLAPLGDAVKAGEIDALTLYPCNGTSYSVTGGGLKRFWRRQRPYSHWLEGAGGRDQV